MTVVWRKLGIKMINNIVPISHIVKILVDAFITIGKKTHSKDRNAARRVSTQEIVNKNVKFIIFLKPTSKLFNLNTLYRYCIRREHIEKTSQTDFWALISRLSRFNTKLIDAVKELVQGFWHHNTTPSSNQKDVLKY